MHSGAISSFIRLVVIGGIVFTAAGVVQSQTTKTSATKPDLSRATSGRTPWGDPDLQGIYSSDDFRGVPFERPVVLGEREFLTDEEYAKGVQELEKQLQEDAVNRSARHRWSSIRLTGEFRTGMGSALPQIQSAACAEPRSTAPRISLCWNDA
jgi:hypothetical protein